MRGVGAAPRGGEHPRRVITCGGQQTTPRDDAPSAPLQRGECGLRVGDHPLATAFQGLPDSAPEPMLPWAYRVQTPAPMQAQRQCANATQYGSWSSARPERAA